MKDRCLYRIRVFVSLIGLLLISLGGFELSAQSVGTATTIGRHEEEQRAFEQKNKKPNTEVPAPQVPAAPTSPASPALPPAAIGILNTAEGLSNGAVDNNICAAPLDVPGAAMDSARETEIRSDYSAIFGFYEHLNGGRVTPESMKLISSIDQTIKAFGESSSTLDDQGYELLADALNKGFIAAGLFQVGADGKVTYSKKADAEGYVEVGSEKIRSDEVLNYVWQTYGRPKMVEKVGEEKTADFEKNCAFGFGLCSKAGCQVSRR